MKKILPLFILSACASSYALDQQTVDINGYYHTGTSATRIYIDKVLKSKGIDTAEVEVNLIADSTQDQSKNVGYMYGASDVKIRSFIAKDSTSLDGKGGVNIANATSHSNGVTGLTIDINSETAETAVDVAWWKQNYIKTIIKNSASNTTEIAVNLGEYLELWGSGTQTTQFIFDNINANVTANNFKIGSSGEKATLQVTNTAKLTLNGNLEISANSTNVLLDVDGDLVTNNATTINKNGVVDVSGTWNNKVKIDVKNGGKLDVSGLLSMGASLYLFSGAQADISGTIKTANKTISIANGATMNVSGTLTMEGGSYMVISGTGTLNVTNTNPEKRLSFLSFNDASTTGGVFNQSIADDSVKADNRGVLLRRTAYLNNATWNLDEVLDLRGDIVAGANADVTTAKLYVKGTSKITLHNREKGGNARLIMRNLSKAYLQAENCITDQNGNYVPIIIAKDSSTAEYTTELHISANQTFTLINFADDLKLFLDDDSSTLRLTRTDAGTLTFTAGTLSIYGFDNNRIYVGEHANTYKILDRIYAYADMNGKEALGALIINDGWLVTMASVPEPAEWAMILGGLALGLAIYRRRK